MQRNANQTSSTCCYCGVGCGVLIDTEIIDGKKVIVGVQGDPSHPANLGKLCSKGANLHLTAAPTIQNQARLTKPEIREDKTQERRTVSWDNALDHAAIRFAQIIQEHGPDAVAFYVSGQLLTEDYYIFNKLAKGLIGTNNIDTNSRLCMSSAVAGYKASLGADAPPCSYADIDHAAVFFISGSNTAFAHPVLYRRIEQRRSQSTANQRQSKTIVVDPRMTDTAHEADLFLPILPGTDVALYNAMLHQMLWEDWIDKRYIDAHTEGFEVLRSEVRNCSPAWASRICGVPEADIITAAKWFYEGPTLSLYCQGLNQSTQGTDKNTALINLHLVTGQIGKPGAGPFSLTGQPNAMGGREVGGLANLMSAHRDMADPIHRREVAALWNIDEVPSRPGKTAVEMFEAVRQGQIKAIWIACTNPANSMPDSLKVKEALRVAQFVVVQEAFNGTATAEYADLLLPATTWGEKEGTVTNSERRISRVRAAVAPFEQARNDWKIAADFARRLQEKLSPLNLASDKIDFNFPSPEAVWNEHRESTRLRDLDITGMSYDLLEHQGPQQWPMPLGAKEGQQRLYTDGKFATPSGKARLLFSQYQPIIDKTSARYPLVLNTGRLRDQWHSMSRTGLLGQAFSHESEPALEMNSVDMERRRLAEGDYVQVHSARAKIIVQVKQSTAVRSGQSFMSMHWGPEVLLSGAINELTQPAFDPRSKQPELKAAAIRVEKIVLQERLTIFGLVKPDQAITLQRRIAQILKSHQNEYQLCLPLPIDKRPGQTQVDEGLLVRIASSQKVAPDLIESITKIFALDDKRVLRYQDKKAGQMRVLWVNDGLLRFGLIQGDTRSEQWLMQMLQQYQVVPHQSQWMLLAGEASPIGLPKKSKTVCNCLGVTETTLGVRINIIRNDNPVISQNDCLVALQKQTLCSTQCGSCLPEVKGIIRDNYSIASESSNAS